jgi:hypothetical protein
MRAGSATVLHVEGGTRGVIDPGGEVEGCVFFEPLPAHLDRVRFQFVLVDADSGDHLAEASIPFSVDRTP